MTADLPLLQVTGALCGVLRVSCHAHDIINDINRAHIWTLRELRLFTTRLEQADTRETNRLKEAGENFLVSQRA